MLFVNYLPTLISQFIVSASFKFKTSLIHYDRLVFSTFSFFFFFFDFLVLYCEAQLHLCVTSCLPKSSVKSIRIPSIIAKSSVLLFLKFFQFKTNNSNDMNGEMVEMKHYISFKLSFSIFMSDWFL